MAAGRCVKEALTELTGKKYRYFAVPAARALCVATPPETWGRIKPHGGVKLHKGEPRPYVYCPWSLQNPWGPPDYWYIRPVRSVWVPKGIVPEPKNGLTYVFEGKGREGNWYGVWQLVLKRGNPTVLTLGPPEPTKCRIKPRRRTSTVAWRTDHRQYATEAPEWGNEEDDFDPLPRFPRNRVVSATPPPAGDVLYHIEQHRVESDAKPLTPAAEVLYHTERHRLAFLNLFTDWKHGKPLELGPPTVPGNIFYTDPKLAMFWSKRLDVRKYPELDVYSQWRRAGLKDAIDEPSRRSKWITRERKRYLNREHYLNGLIAIAHHLVLPQQPISWRVAVDVVGHNGETIIKRAGERFNLGSVAAEDAARVIARQGARRRQTEAAYTLAGYVSATTGKMKSGIPTQLTRALGSVDCRDYRIPFRKPKDDHDSFRAALDLELPGAIYLAAHDGRPPDLERRVQEDDGGEPYELYYKRATKAYNEQLRKLGYRGWDWGSEKWKTLAEGKPLPKPLETEIRRLAKDTRLWVTYANRRCRRDFGDVWKVRDGDERRKLLPDTRSDGSDPGNGYQNTKGWQEYDSGHKPDPAEYDIEVAVAEGDVLVPGSSQADPELNPDLGEKLRNEAISDEDTLAQSPRELEDVDGEVEDASLTLDFDTHHSLNFRVDEKGEKHLVRLEFAQSDAVKGFRKFARKYDPEKYATAYTKGMLPDSERQQLYPSYREAVLLDLLGERRLPEAGEDSGTFVRYEDEETGERRTVETSKLVDLRHEFDSDGPSRFELTERQREVFGCYYGTSDMTMAAIAKRLNVTTRTVQRAMEEVRKKLAQAGILLPAQAERRGRTAA